MQATVALTSSEQVESTIHSRYRFKPNRSKSLGMRDTSHKLSDGTRSKGLVKSEKPLACPKISVHDEIGQLFRIVSMKTTSKDFKRAHWKTSMLVSGVILLATPLNIAEAKNKGWQFVRDEFLQGDPELLQFHCDRGKEANRESVSAFNDAWVKDIKKLRSEAGVAPIGPDGSNQFFSGLSMAMKSRCPGVW